MTAAPLEDLATVGREVLEVLRSAELDPPLGLEAMLAILAERLEAALEDAEPLTRLVLTTGALAGQWQVSPATVRGWIDDGDLAAFNAGRGTVPRWRVTVPEALRFARARKKPGAFHAPHAAGSAKTAS